MSLLAPYPFFTQLVIFLLCLLLTGGVWKKMTWKKKPWYKGKGKGYYKGYWKGKGEFASLALFGCIYQRTFLNCGSCSFVVTDLTFFISLCRLERKGLQGLERAPSDEEPDHAAISNNPCPQYSPWTHSRAPTRPHSLTSSTRCNSVSNHRLQHVSYGVYWYYRYVTSVPSDCHHSRRDKTLFSTPHCCAISDWALVDANRDLADTTPEAAEADYLEIISEGQVFSLSELRARHGTNDFALVCVTDPRPFDTREGWEIGSVGLRDENHRTHEGTAGFNGNLDYNGESSAPYTLADDNSGNYNPTDWTIGYTSGNPEWRITCQAFCDNSLRGEESVPRTRTFIMNE